MANFFLVFLLYSQGNCGILRNETRLVMMPELQGHGIGPKISTMVGALMKTSGPTNQYENQHWDMVDVD